MVEKANVRLRWFRTVETTCDSVSLRFVKKDKWLNSIELVWDNNKKLYESSVSEVGCGKHSTNLRIDGMYYHCKEFTVVPDTFEVHLFLLKEKLDDSISDHIRLEKYYQAKMFSPLQVNVDWSPDTSYLADLNRSTYYDCQTELPKEASSSVSVKWDVYEDMLAGKNQEIRNLQNELKQLRLSVVDIYSRNLSKTPDSMRLNVESYDNIKLESHTDSNQPIKVVENGYGMDEKNNTDSHGEKHLLEDIKATKEELRVVCQKNKDLYDDVLHLREDNAKLRKLLEEANRPPVKTPIIDPLYFSEPDSESTQYRQLPSSMTNIYASKSLPTLDTRETAPTPPRRFASFIDTITSRSSEEVRIKVGSSTQTDITAVEDPPKRYKRLKQRVKSDTRSSDQSLAPSGLTRESLNDKEFSDTEDLLQEAEIFVVRTLGNIDTFDNTPLQWKDGVFQSTDSSEVPDRSFKDVSFRPSTNSTVLGKRKKLRPFLPKSAKDLKPGHIIRHFTTDGKVKQGKVAYLSSVPGESSLVIVTEELDTDASFLSSSPRRTFVPYKKVILAWEEWSFSFQLNA